MAAVLLSDALWDLIEPLLPVPPLRPHGGRPRVPDRACLTGILFVLRSGIPWQLLPREWAADRALSAGDACGTGSKKASGT